MSFYKNEIIRGDLDIRKGLTELKYGIRDIEKGLCEMEHGIIGELEHCGCYNNCFYNNCCSNNCGFSNNNYCCNKRYY